MNIPAHRTHWWSPLSTAGAAPYTSADHWHLLAWCTSGTPTIDRSRWSNQYQTLLHPPPEEKEGSYRTCSLDTVTWRKKEFSTLSEKSVHKVIVYLCVKLCEEVEMFFEVSGQDGFNDEEAKAFEFHVFKVNQEVVLRLRHEEVPGWSCMMVFQDRSVIVQKSLWRAKGDQCEIIIITKNMFSYDREQM